MTWVPLKYYCAGPPEYGLNIPAGEYSDDGVRFLRTTDIGTQGGLGPGDGVYVPREATLEPRHRLRTGDLLFSRSGSLGRCLRFDASMGEATYAGYLVRFRPGPHADPRFLEYCAQSEPFQAAIEADAITSTISNFNAERYASIKVPYLPTSEQRAIADYLDAETARIDALITKKQQLIHLLNERIDASIMDVVGGSVLVSPRGHPTVEVRRLLAKLNRQPMVADMITAFRDGQVTTRSARGKDGFTNSWTDNAQVQGVQVGDVVVHGLDGFSGAIGDSEADGACSPVYHVCQPRDGGDPVFYGRMLRLLALSGYLGNFAVSTRERAVDFRNWDLFGRIPIPHVEVRQQRAIGDRIRSLRPLVDLVQQSESLAIERKTALVSRVVAGAIEVPVSA